MGRPTMLDDLRAKRVVDAVAKGVSRTAQAALAGVSRATLMDWLARGRDGEPLYADFLDRVKEAEAKAEAMMVECVQVAACDPARWQAAAWWLERTRPGDYAKREPTKDEEIERAETGENDLDVARAVLAALESRKVG